MLYMNVALWWLYPAVHPLQLLGSVDPLLALKLLPLPHQPRPERHLVLLTLLLLFLTLPLLFLMQR